MSLPAIHARRRFLQSSAALLVSFTFADSALAAIKSATSGAGPAEKSLDPKSLDAYLAVQADGSVTVYTGKVDLGTGNMTALAQIVAEEMALPIERIAMVQGDTSLTVDQGITYGSLSIQVAGVTLRQAGATAREALKALAVTRFGVTLESIVLQNGAASVAGNPAQTLTYAALLHDKTLNLALDPRVAVKNYKQYTLVGTPVQREDIPGKVTGEFTYMQDMRVPGMLHARLIRPASLGANLLTVDATSIRAIKDVQIVRKGNFLAVVAKTEWAAIKAARTLKVSWSQWAGLPAQQDLYAALRTLKVADRVTMVNSGDLDNAMSTGAKTLKSNYTWPAQTHGSIGPSCAIADFKEGNLTLWSATQAPHLTRDQVAAMLALKSADVRLIYVEGAGCYGRNGHEDATADAALIAVTLGKPVRVQWMRHDEHGWDPKGPPVINDLAGAVDIGGRIVAWRHETWEPHRIKPSADVPLLANELVNASSMIDEPSNPGSVEKNTPPPYKVPNVQAIVNKTATTFFRPAWLRGPGRLQNTFANESFMDELAFLAGTDPVQMRMRHLDDARGLAVLTAVTEKAGWQTQVSHSKPARSGELATGRGVAYVRYDGDRTYVAAVAEVEVNRTTGVVRVTKFTVAHDCGLVINPDGVINQIEGQVVQTISRTLYEEVTFTRSAITSVDWASYPILRFPQVPKIDVVLIDRPDKAAWGAGEPACAVVPSAIAGAIFDAVGVRLRNVPFRPEHIMAALKA
ncbi:MAG: xanthine dehydrogenase family protein molybdopterin-binding subunit [Massilia sp.]|nr:xanthine dehydrogenase family protein molybdopterin-binding subunit [Massilia sp.]